MLGSAVVLQRVKDTLDLAFNEVIFECALEMGNCLLIYY